MKTETLIGGDLSHYNYGKVNPTAWSFVMLKATEGSRFKDEAMEKYLLDIALAHPTGENMPFIGFYHFARPNRNSVTSELNNYLAKIKPHIGNCLTALDWEDDALTTIGGEEWALKWLRECEKATGSKPLFYCSASELKRFKQIVEEFPIWVAHYHSQHKHDECDKYTMWQITSNPFDIDVFNGGRKEMASLIKGI